MARNGEGIRLRPFSVRLVRGEPYHVAGRELVPVVRVVSLGKGRGTIGARRVGGWGGAFVLVKPLAVLEKTPKGIRRITIVDATTTAVRGLIGAAVVSTVVFATARVLAGRRR